MTEYHDHRDDCPFKFATLDACDCVEKNMLDRIEALTKERDREKAYAFQCAINLDTALEQLTAARQDAKAAEDELEMQEQEACMMENDYLKLEKERDALEGKLAKAVEGLEKIAGAAVMEWTTARCGGLCDIARATLAEIKGESHE